MYSHKEQASAANQQNIFNSFSILWVKCISQHCVGSVFGENKLEQIVKM
jgi:hypothetical protein